MGVGTRKSFALFAILITCDSLSFVSNEFNYHRKGSRKSYPEKNFFVPLPLTQ
jgi:hypothetical protein